MLIGDLPSIAPAARADAKANACKANGPAKTVEGRTAPLPVIPAKAGIPLCEYIAG